MKKIEKLFKIKERGSSVRTEIVAGITTFLAMAYILAVIPEYMSNAGIPIGAAFTATALSAAVGTLCMAFLANYPVALASGMGLSAFFAYTVCGTMGCSYKVALTAIFVEGIIFIILSFFKFRETLVNKIPNNLKYAITVGIGLFITIIALVNANVVVSNESTVVGLGDLASPEVVLAVAGLLIIGILHHYKISGAILLGIIATWVLGMIAELIGWYVPNPEVGVFSVMPSFSKSAFQMPVLFDFDFNYVINNFTGFVVIVFTFLYSDIFDTVGTLIGVAEKGDMLDEKGELPKVGRALTADAIGTIVGSCVGSPTVTSYVESSAGVAAGGRTGFASVVTAVLFLMSLVLAPVFTAIPGFATTPAMLYVGLLMLSSIKKIDFEGDVADAIGAFLAIIMMPLTYSIANGIMFGMLAWVILKIFTGKIKDVSGIMWVSVLLFAVYIALKILGIA